MRWCFWAFSVMAPFLLGFLSMTWGSARDNEWYASLKKPAWQPPGWAFSVIWSLLFILFGLSFAFLLRSQLDEKQSLIGFLVALWVPLFALLMIWPGVFFGRRKILGGLITIVLALVATLTLVVWLFAIGQTIAAVFLVPLALWLAVATALNIRILEDNQ